MGDVSVCVGADIGNAGEERGEQLCHKKRAPRSVGSSSCCPYLLGLSLPQIPSVGKNPPVQDWFKLVWHIHWAKLLQWPLSAQSRFMVVPVPRDHQGPERLGTG